MASKIKVDTLETADGTGSITLNNPLAGDGSGLTGTGKVLQVVSTTKTDFFSFNYTGGWVTVTGMSVTLPAIQTGSKILVTGVVHFGQRQDANPTGRIRDSIDGLVKLPSSSGQTVGHFSSGYNNDSQELWRLFPSSFQYEYTPATTASRTFTTEVTNGDTTNWTCWINRSESDDAAGWNSRAISTITVMEIGA